MTIRDSIVRAARAAYAEELALQSKGPDPEGRITKRVHTVDSRGRQVRSGYKRLQDIFARGLAGSVPETDPAWKSIANGKESWPGGASWCGIAATTWWQAAGVNVKWLLGIGPKGASTFKVQFWDWADISGLPVNERTAENIYLEPGDMAIIPEYQHHFVVLEIGADRRSLTTMDANTSFGEINPSTKHKVADLVSYWKPTIAAGETRFPPTLFKVPGSTTPKAPLSSLVGEWLVRTGGVDYYYKFDKDKTVTWSTTRGGNDGAGRVWSAGGGWVKLAWKSGTIELWNPSELVVGGQVTGTYYYHASTIALTATRL